MLPSHGLPFRGIPLRVAQLRAHHDARLAELLEAIAAAGTPVSAAQMVPILFRRPLDLQQRFFAMGEAIAHLNYLWRRDRVRRTLIGRRHAPLRRLILPHHHNDETRDVHTRHRHEPTIARFHVARRIARLRRRKSAKAIGDFAARNAKNGGSMPTDELGLGKAFMELAAQMLANPARLAESQMNLWWEYMSLWQGSMLRLMGAQATPVAVPAKGDKRFKHEDWHEHFLFDYIKQSYLITARWMHDQVASVEGLDEPTKKKVDFFTRQYIDALAPSNFALTNPEVFRETVASGGQNLVKGLNNLLDDIERGGGQLRISMTDAKAFELGVNIATTPGKVVFQNDLMQLIQYEPTTKKVLEAPAARHSAVDQQVLHPRPAREELLSALGGRRGHDGVRDLVGQSRRKARAQELRGLPHRRHAGGARRDRQGDRRGRRERHRLLPRRHAARRHARPSRREEDDKRIASATFMTSLIDFTAAGELEVFIDEAQVASLEKRMNERGYLEGSEMATTFNMLRANDLIWSFVINNYLLGRDPFPFDLLHWNCDSTRMPAAMHSFYLRNMYMKNLLVKPEALTLAGTKIDLSQGRHAGLFRVGDRRSHRAVEDDLRRHADPERQVAIRAVGLRTHCGNGESARREQIRVLDQRQAARDTGCLVRRREAARGLVVAELAAMGDAVPRARSPGARARQGQVEGDRSGAGHLRAHPRRRK